MVLSCCLGYPEKTIMETGFANTVRLIVTLVASYLIPIAISCLTYLALICDKARVGKNCIDIQSKTPHDEENHISDIDKQQIRTSDTSDSLNPSLERSVENPLHHHTILIKEAESCKADRQQQHESSSVIKSTSEKIDAKSCDVTIDREDFSDEKLDLDLKVEERRQSEIRAAKRSIETNLLLCLIFFIVYGIFIFVSSRYFQFYFRDCSKKLDRFRN